MSDPFFVILHDYGWGVVVVWILVREIWPSVRDRVVPQYAQERLRKIEQADVERERLKTLEERQITAFERVGDAVNQLVLLGNTTNERLAALATQTGAHDVMVRQAITEMRQTVAKREGEETARKSRPKTGA